MTESGNNTFQKAFKLGLVLGILLAMGQATLGVLSSLFYGNAVGDLLGRAILWGTILLYLYAGYRGAREQGTLGAGSLAAGITGFISAGVSFLLFFITSFLWFHSDPSTWVSGFGISSLSSPFAWFPTNVVQGIVEGTGSYFLFLLLIIALSMWITAGFGAAIGTVGAFFGKRAHQG